LEELGLVNQVEVRLQQSVFLDLSQVVYKTLKVCLEVVTELAHGVAGLIDEFCLFTRELIKGRTLARHDLDPDGHNRDGVRQRELDQVYSRSQLEDAEVVQVQVE